MTTRQEQIEAIVDAVRRRPVLPFRPLSRFEVSELTHLTRFGLVVFIILAVTTVAITVAAVRYSDHCSAAIMLLGIAAGSGVCAFVVLASVIRSLILLRQHSPVLVEARHRGDYVDFAAQLRRNPKPARWRARDVRRALPTIDEWARAAE